MTNRWLTLDCFGTLVDWRHGIERSCDLVFPGKGCELLGAFNRFEPQVQAELPWRRYREVLREALRRSAQHLELELRPDDEDILSTTIPYWPVFPDVSALALCRKGGWRLALLTNCDRDLVALTLRRLPPLFDMVVTAEDVGSYKPQHGHFERFRDLYRPEPGCWVHVAQSVFHDIKPAESLGIPAVWVNRQRESAEVGSRTPVVSTLDALAEVLSRS